MTYKCDFADRDEQLDGEQLEGEQFDGAQSEDERLRELLAEAAPEFSVTSALGDRALAGAARRRARVRVFGGVGAAALVGVGVLAVAPLAGWGGRGSGVAAAGAVGTSVGAPAASPSSSSDSMDPAFYSAAKNAALDRVAKALVSGHGNSFMGVSLNGQNEASPIIVYRKPSSDPTLERVALAAAAPFKVVFHDTVLDSSEQWYLGNRMQQDMGYWQGRGVVFGTALQGDGTITIYTRDPAKVVPLLEQHYGYDGRVFVGLQDPPAPTGR